MHLSVPLRVAITGMGGFAASHHRTLLSLEETGACHVVATCDPFPDNFRAQQAEWRFAGRGVRVFDDWQKMLDEMQGQIDVLTVPAPVPLHAPMHKAAVERGIACYLEKPPTLFWRELDEMLEVEKKAKFATNVGFNFIVETARQNLKKRILDGEFGRLLHVSFLGHWPRPKSYFTRAPWAGKISLDGRLVLDSCIGNAMAHYIHNILFWAGTKELFDWAQVEELEAELSRTHDIENYDTVLSSGRFENGVSFRIAATHASRPPQYQREEIECEKARITYITGNEWRIDWKDGRVETGETDRGDLLARNFVAYFDYLRGCTSRPLTTLEDSKPFVHLTNLVYVAAGKIDDEEEENIERDGEWVAIRDIAEILELSRQAYWKGRVAQRKNLTPAADVVKLEEILKAMQTS